MYNTTVSSHASSLSSISCFQVTDRSSVGPRKLSKILVLVLEKWRKIQSASYTTQQASPLTDNLTPREHTESQANNTLSEVLYPENNHQDRKSGSLGLTDRPLLSRDVHASRILSAKPGALKRRNSSPPSASLDGMADYLLVDDNGINLKVRDVHNCYLPAAYIPAHLQILSSYVKKLGRTYDTAMNGLEALNACRTRSAPYRCILMGK